MRDCAVCGKDIEKRSPSAEVCSPECRAIRKRQVGRAYDKKRDRTEYYKNNRNRINARSYRWRLAHLDDVNARAREKWHNDIEHRMHKLRYLKERSDNPSVREKIREWFRQDYARNPEKYREWGRASWWKNRVKRLEAQRKWKQHNVEQYRSNLRQYGRECRAAVTALKELGFTEGLQGGAPVARRILRELQLT